MKSSTEFLELFLRNLLLNEHHPLHNRTLHISGAFKESEKPDIKASRASDLLREMTEHGIIKPMFGHGKRQV